MITGFNALVGIIILFLIAAVATVIAAWYRLRGPRVITCPETLEVEVVEVNATRGALEELVTEPHLRLRSCTRWPERQDCGQDCLTQIEDSRNGCLLVAILEDWYHGKDCAFCGKTFEAIHWHDHKPALMGPEKKLVDWEHVPGKDVFRVLETHKPVCWNCFVAESFRQGHPELVTDREWKRNELGEYTETHR